MVVSRLWNAAALAYSREFTSMMGNIETGMELVPTLTKSNLPITPTDVLVEVELVVGLLFALALSTETML